MADILINRARAGQESGVVSVTSMSIAAAERFHEKLARAIVEKGGECASDTSFDRGVSMKTVFRLPNSATFDCCTSVSPPPVPEDLLRLLLALDGVYRPPILRLLGRCERISYATDLPTISSDMNMIMPESLISAVLPKTRERIFGRVAAMSREYTDTPAP